MRRLDRLGRHRRVHGRRHMDPVAGAQANDAEAAPPERERLTRDISVSARPGAAVARPPPEGTKLEDRRVAERSRDAEAARDPDRKSDVKGKSVSARFNLGWLRLLKKK